ncbi:hypothetical protein GJ698_24290 [Pseudoduganella sp. FT26W]|uniref:Uncharacterized protein n=1 Tax=Duganella aquatilis TaxID=2666082 RepID=A0A844D2Y1_9BURK|nr:hypothetical protein [Duganella aquatilis]MRW87193.1 hypothetical protein [Duganella aquatilis]
MNAAGTRNLPPPPILPAIVYDELRSYLRESGSTLSASEALIKAVQFWIAKGRADAIPSRGYQWKQLFLPEGTRLRMRFNERWYTAAIAGDNLVYNGKSVSPNQMAVKVAGDGRNAWHEIWVLLPGHKQWANAAMLRAQLMKQSVKVPPTAAEAMTIAAKAMSDALSTALTLVAHANDQAQNTLERRLPKYRRAWDQLEDVE